jgi:DUF1365 family protein
MRSAIYEGVVTHVRRKPFTHRMRYGLFSLLIDLDEVDELSKIPFFSHNRPNLVSFHDRDHGPGDGSSLPAWIASEMRRIGIAEDPGSIRLLCLPRILGYQFNPLTVWFIDDREGEPRWVLYEIHNTFGEAHSHLADLRHGEQRFAKELHVSPFFDVSGEYRVRIRQPGERLSIVIDYDDGEAGALTATLTALRRPLTAGGLMASLIRYPFVTMKVIAAIHFEAAKVWLKGARYRRKPPAPLDSVSASANMVT